MNKRNKPKIHKYVIYATRIDADHPWMWWARPPLGAPVRFRTWTRAAGFLALHHELRKPERKRP